MKKRFTEEEIAEIIGKMAEKIRSEMDEDVVYARMQMRMAEDELLKSLNEKQRELYEDFCKKREAFYGLVNGRCQK